MKTLAGTVLGVAGAALIAAGCSAGTAAAPTGTVQGRLLAYPGPMPSNGKPPANPMAGTVAFTDKSGLRLGHVKSPRPKTSSLVPTTA